MKRKRRRNPGQVCCRSSVGVFRRINRAKPHIVKLFVMPNFFFLFMSCAGSSSDSEDDGAGDGVTAKSFIKKKPAAEAAPEASKFLKGATAVSSTPLLIP